MNDIVGILMFMLYLVLAYLLLRNANGFANIINTAGTNWRQTLQVLQGR